MDPRYSCLVFLLPILTQAQPQLPDFNDTITIPCPLDTSVLILTYPDWEAYQTVDGFWNGAKDSTICIDLAHVQGTYISQYIDVDQIDATRPVFLRWLSDSANAIPLTSNDEYSLDMSIYAYPGSLDLSSNCPGGPCTGWQAAVRVPDWTDSTTALRWYSSPYNSSGSNGYPMHLCVPTEYFADNALQEIIVSMKPQDDIPGQRLYLSAPQSVDLGYSGILVPLTQGNVGSYASGPTAYEFYEWNMNYLVMHPDSTYPDGNHIGFLDFSPTPNVSDSVQVDVHLEPYTGFNFQPYTDLRGGLVLGSDSIRHSVNVINDGADLCLTFQWIDLVIGPGDQYTHKGGYVDFAGEHSCMQFRTGSTFEVGAGSPFEYGYNGRGMLALNGGCTVLIDPGAELDMHGTVILKDKPGATITTDLPIVLKAGAQLTFGQGARISNAGSLGQQMRLEVILDGGSVDLGGLSGADRLKVHMVELPQESVAPLKVLGNPVGDQLAMELSVREPGTWSAHAFDMMGRCVAEGSYNLSAGSNTFDLSTTALRSGSYLLELRNGDVHQVVRFVKP